MRIYILGSNAFMKKMVEVTDQLIQLGVNAHIAPHYREMVAGTGRQDMLNMYLQGERAEVKQKYNTFMLHYNLILESDAVLFVNETKNGIENYIGGNVLIEMGQAYVNNKKIFFLNNMPTNPKLTYLDEIVAMQPICLGGQLSLVKNY